MNDFIAPEILFDVVRFNELKESKILDDINPQNLFLFSAIIEMLIRLRDLLYKSEMVAGKKVNFKDDVIITDTVKDVTDLIKYARDAACHIESSKNIINDNNYSNLSIIIGKGMLQMDLPSSDYEDDLAIIFGKQRIYYKRHMLRSFNDAIENLLPLTGLYEDAIESILRKRKK
jgi:hypothetical protein